MVLLFGTALFPDQSHLACRQLYNNRLTGSIPSTIGQLTALQNLYGRVVLPPINSCSSPLRSQRLAYQSIERLDTVDDWAIDSVAELVRLSCCHWPLFPDQLTQTLLRCIRRELSYNQLTGSIPSTVVQLTALQNL